MKIVVDANIIIAALLGSRAKLTILTSQNHTFYAPRKIIDEIKKYKFLICEKLPCTSDEFDVNLHALLFFLEIIHDNSYKIYIEKAMKLIGKRDSKDADYIACALAFNADFIWSEDKDFAAQNSVPVKNTEHFIFDNK